MLFIGVMKQRKECIQFKWHDHEAGIVSQSFASQHGRRLESHEVTSYLPTVLSELQDIIDSINKLLGPALKDKAFGGLSDPGDVVRIRHLGDRVAGRAEELLDWAARLRSAVVPSGHRRALELMARLVDRPVMEIFDFIDDFVVLTERIPSILADADGQDIHLRRTSSVTMDPAAVRDCLAQLERLAGDGGLIS